MGSFSSSSHDRFLFETCFLLASEAFLDNLLFFRRPSNAGASNSLNSGGLDGHGAISFFGHLATAVESFAIILAIIRIFLNLFGSF